MSTLPIKALRPSFELSLRSANKAPRTVEAYLTALDHFTASLPAGDRTEVADLGRDDVRRWMQAQLEAGAASATVSLRFRALKQFTKWAASEEEMTTDFLVGMAPPHVEVHPVAVLSDTQVAALLGTCKGRSFTALRDAAVIRLLLDTGIRRAELVGLTLEDVDLHERTITVLGKGRRYRTIRYGLRTAQALDRYLRARARHPHAGATPALWLPERGDRPWGADGVRIMLRKRAQAAGIERLHPHMFRHTFAADFLDAGGNETDLMRLAGWRSRQMVDRYGAAVADERARDARDRLTLKGDRL